jgi:hypothetical protein
MLKKGGARGWLQRERKYRGKETWKIIQKIEG